MNDDFLEKAFYASEAENYSEAIQILTPYANDGNLEAQYRLASLYFTGAGISRADCIKCLKLAAEQNVAAAQYRLACFRQTDLMIGTPDTVEGLSLLFRSAEGGYAEAQRDLGCMFATGDGIERDLSIARRWYGLAAEAGNTDAQYNFAFMLFLGEGGPVDFEGGKKYMELAALGREEQAIRFLAESYQLGSYGFPVNSEISETWRSKLS